MPTFARQTTGAEVHLRPGKQQTIPLPELTPGAIIADASFIDDDIIPNPRHPDDGDDPPRPLKQLRLELLHAGSVVATGVNHVFAMATARDSAWQLRITDTRRTGKEVGYAVTIDFTGTRQILTRRIALSAFQRIFDEFWNRRTPVSLRINDNVVTIKFAPDLAALHNLQPIEIQLGTIEVDLPGPFDPDVTIRDVNSTRITFSTTTGPNPVSQKYPQAAAFSLNFSFEDEGTELEINKFPDVDLKDFALRIDFFLVALAGCVSYSPQVTFTGRVDVNILPNDLAFRRVKEKVEEKVKEHLLSGTARAEFAASITPWLLGEPFRVFDVGFDGGFLLIDYLEPEGGSVRRARADLRRLAVCVCQRRLARAVRSRFNRSHHPAPLLLAASAGYGRARKRGERHAHAAHRGKASVASTARPARICCCGMTTTSTSYPEVREPRPAKAVRTCAKEKTQPSSSQPA